jgi:hypothetical protein
MAIAFVRGVSRTGFQNQTSATSGTLAATPTENNLLLMYTYMQDNPSGRTVTPPASWTLLKAANDSDEWSSAWMYRIAPASAATSYTWTWTGNSFNQGSYLFELSGVDTTTPIDVSAAAFTYEGFDATWSEAAITTATAGAWDIVSVTCKDNATYALTSPASPVYTERVDVGGIGAIYTVEIAAAGTTGVRSGTSPNYDKLTYSFAVRPSGGGGGGGATIPKFMFQYRQRRVH